MVVTLKKIRAMVAASNGLDVPSLSEHRGACQALYTDAVLREQIYPCPKLKKTGLKTP
jgi:hypothetical protein